MMWYHLSFDLDSSSEDSGAARSGAIARVNVHSGVDTEVGRA